MIGVVEVGYEDEPGQPGAWDGWQNVGWGMSNWTLPPPPPPSDPHVSLAECLLSSLSLNVGL